jgi:UDP-3-O-[3-hydroxymyristoyl] glucosamine N-acyltransferase
MVTRTLEALAADLGGEVIGDGATVIRGVAGIREALPGDLTFIANSRYDSHLAETRASAVICSREKRETGMPLLVVDNPYLAFQRAVRIFRPDQYRPPAGIHPTAVVGADVTLGREVAIGPHCIVEAGVTLGDRVVLMGGCYVGHRVTLGDDSYLYPRVVVRDECVLGARCIVHSGAVIGSDGFGFAFDDGRYHKVPQVGNVVIGDDVEIGANTTIDRATTHSTRIGDGSKIDNLVQIGHNVVVGRHCIIVAQVGVSGSTELEDHVTLGGQAGLVGHIKIGTGATVGAQSGVTKSVTGGTIVTGYPATQHSAWRRLQAFIHRLPDLFQRTRALEDRVTELEGQREREGVR